MKSKLKAPGTKRSKLKFDHLLSSFAFNFNLRRYSQANKFASWAQANWVLRGVTDVQVVSAAADGATNTTMFDIKITYFEMPTGRAVAKSSSCFQSAAQPPAAVPPAVELVWRSYFRKTGTLYFTEESTVYAGQLAKLPFGQASLAKLTPHRARISGSAAE